MFRAGKAVTLDVFADLHGEMEIRERADTGLVVIYSGQHSKLGEIVLIQHVTHGCFLVAEAGATVRCSKA